MSYCGLPFLLSIRGLSRASETFRKWLIILAPLAMVFVLSFGAQRMRPATAQLMFWIFSALIGLFASAEAGWRGILV